VGFEKNFKSIKSGLRNLKKMCIKMSVDFEEKFADKKQDLCDLRGEL
jgi:hypothetical protein